MLQPRAMILRPRRIGRLEPLSLSLRQFSISTTLKADSPPPAARTPSATQPNDQPKKLKLPPVLLKLKNSNVDKLRPRRIIDARSLAASKPGGQPANILRGPRRLEARGGTPLRARKPVNAKAAPRAPRRPRLRNLAGEDENKLLRSELEDVYREIAEKTKPIPTHYQPNAPDFQNLSETWPSLPTDITATTAGVAEKLSLLSERYPNGYIPPYVLGKRLMEGKFVRFTSEAERAEALEAAKKFAQEAADKLSQKKGELVDPQAVIFQRVKGEAHKTLIESLVQGKYPMVEKTPANKPPVVGEILRNLRNNESYQTSGKRTQFMAKLDSLLVSSRPVKRA
ncbi:uncharacterized protein DSM5745_05362 [Aspergillus mulundensis]|uniref:Uncharacterized protein n=1 Tax=Aspergillus mulundensis TaxID=1810919 RepID=A0A3D8S666_9EURO|nr:Uncharacterized protein DSM5745_05362 [Aspergillus mulundensis]RDW81805.1 Uncharacterized protein DSM5745_05362 [Aspergillus mulundensis]